MAAHDDIRFGAQCVLEVVATMIRQGVLPPRGGQNLADHDLHLMVAVAAALTRN